MMPLLFYSNAIEANFFFSEVLRHDTSERGCEQMND